MATAEQNKAIILRFVDELRKGNLAIIDEVCSPDFVFHSPNWPNWPRGIEGAPKLATYGSQLYRDARATIDDIIAENDRVAVRWTVTGTWIGDQRPGCPPYGTQVARLNELVPLRRRGNRGGLGHRGILADRNSRIRDWRMAQHWIAPKWLMCQPLRSQLNSRNARAMRP
jgi:hypothetical protein